MCECSDPTRWALETMVRPPRRLITIVELTTHTGDFIGGDLHWETGLSLITPFPTRPNWPLKCHAFVNAGRLTQFDQSERSNYPPFCQN